MVNFVPFALSSFLKRLIFTNFYFWQSFAYYKTSKKREKTCLYSNGHNFYQKNAKILSLPSILRKKVLKIAVYISFFDIKGIVN